MYFFFYKIFVKMKFTKPCYQIRLSKEFEIHDTHQWEKTYVSKMLDVENRQLSDFNYRLLNTCNILCNNTYLCKWNVILKKNNKQRRHCLHVSCCRLHVILLWILFKCLTRFTLQDEAFPNPRLWTFVMSRKLQYKVYKEWCFEKSSFNSGEPKW